MDMSSDGTLAERLTNAANHSMSEGRSLIALSKDEASRILATYARIAELEAELVLAPHRVFGKITEARDNEPKLKARIAELEAMEHQCPQCDYCWRMADFNGGR